MNISKTLYRAERIRETASGEASDVNKVQSGYLEAISILQEIIDQHLIESLDNLDEKSIIGIGQAVFSIATIYTSLAKHGSQDESQIREFLSKANQTLEHPHLLKALPVMVKYNLTGTDDPMLWEAEIERVKARISERQPNRSEADTKDAIDHYSEAIKLAYLTYLQATASKNRQLELAALSAYATALGERAQLRNENEQLIILNEMVSAMSIIWSLYKELPNFDRTETVIGRVIRYCQEYQIPVEHPVYQQAVILYLELAKISKPEDHHRYRARLEQISANQLTLPSQIITFLKTII